MLFHDITDKNIMELAKYFSVQQFRTCDYTPTALFMWKDYFKSKYAVYDDNLIIKNISRNDLVSFTFPVGMSPVAPTLCAISNYAAENSLPLAFDSVPLPAIESLRQYFEVTKNRRIEILQSDDWSDYLYDKNDLIFLRGKKYAGQRNHINKLLSTSDEIKYLPINRDNIHRIRKFFELFRNGHGDSGELMAQENDMASQVIDKFFDFGLSGGFIEADGEVISFAMGEIVGDTLFVHIEKGLRDVQGSYAMINREFAAHNAGDGVVFVNREEDLGVEGLRKAKLSYHPVELLKKHYVFVSQE